MRVSTLPVTTVSNVQRQLMHRGGAIQSAGRVTSGGTLDHVASRPALDRRPEDDNDFDNFHLDGSRKDRHEHKPRFKVELLCRTFVGDNGVRPLASVMFWESPDIWIEGPMGDPDIATPGVVNKVRVHIWNLGLADCWAAHVDAYWCNPSVGLNSASAQPIGSTVVALAAGQHTIVSFDWTPVLVNGGHECLIAQVYDPVSDPIVAPFNPVQDRHVAQRNISVVQLAAGKTMKFDLFTQNLSHSPAGTTLEIQKLKGSALKLVAMALGCKPWPNAGATEVEISQPVPFARPSSPYAAQLATALFRETLQDLPPGISENRRVAGTLRSLAATRHELGRGEPFGFDVHAAPATQGRQELSAARAELTRDGTRLSLRMPPGAHLRFGLTTALPKTARRGSADVFRIVERTAGQITGGVTIVVRAE